jgi:hypothetical protein
LCHFKADLQAIILFCKFSKLYVYSLSSSIPDSKIWIKDQRKDPNSTVGTGPCAKWLKGEECPFYPKFAIRKEFKVSCTDAEESYCECIWFCWNNKDINEIVYGPVEGYENCTRRLIFL